MENVIEVTMGTRRYRLRGDDPRLLHALAARVDDQLAEIAGPDGNRDDFKVAVLAALNIASAAEDDRAAWGEQARELDHAAADLERRLETLRAAL